MEVPRVVIGFARLQTAARVAGAQVFNLHYLGPEPSEGLRAGRAGLKLGEVDNAYVLEAIELDANAHPRSPVRNDPDIHAYHCDRSGTTCDSASSSRGLP